LAEYGDLKSLLQKTSLPTSHVPTTVVQSLQYY